MLASILDWLYPGEFRAGRISVTDSGDGPRITTWTVPGVPKPTEAEVLAQEAAYTASGGELAQFRAKAIAMLDALRDTGSMALRATIIETLAYANAHRAKFNALLTWLGTQGTLTQRAQLTAMQLIEATPAQARTAIRNRMTAGEAD